MTPESFNARGHKLRRCNGWKHPRVLNLLCVDLKVVHEIHEYEDMIRLGSVGVLVTLEFDRDQIYLLLAIVLL